MGLAAIHKRGDSYNIWGQKSVGNIISVYICTHYATLDCLFSLQVKNKPTGGIALPVFILELAWSRTLTTYVDHAPLEINPT
jgi:hypothetical protein